MSHRKDLYEAAATLAGGALAVASGTPLAGITVMGVSLAHLIGLARDRKDADLSAAISAARRAAETALRDNRDFTDTDFARAKALIDTAPRSIDPAAFAAAARNGPPETQITANLLAAIDFQPDDHAPRRLLDLILGQTVRTICAHPSMHDSIARAFDVQNAQDTAEILALVRELHSIKETTVPEIALIALARKIQPRVANRDDALRELERATDIAAAVILRGTTGSNLDAFVNDVLHQLATLTTEGRFDDAATLARARLAEAKAGIASLRAASIDAELLAGNAAAAATLIAERVAEDTPDPAARFDALRAECRTWFESGRDKGLRLDLELSISLARIALEQAQIPGRRGESLNDLGNALQTLGEREDGTDRLEEAVAAYRAALGHVPRHLFPLAWATTQMNLGAALRALGQQEGGTDRLEAAVAAFLAALEERTRDRAPLDWAMAQMNLGNALQTLGEQEAGTERLEEAVAAYHAALLEWTRDRAPLQWAMTQMNLGAALGNLGAREAGTARLEEAVAAYRAALLEWTRDRVPLDWAMTQVNLGAALRILGTRQAGTARLEEAVAAYHAALLEWTRDRVPLDWATTQFNLVVLYQAFFDKTPDPAHLDAAQTALDGARDVFAQAEATQYLAQADRQQAAIDARRR